MNNTIQREEGRITLERRIDALTVQNDFWLVVMKGNWGGFSLLQAVPQAISYMAATPYPNCPTFGLVTNGYDYLFVKLEGGEFALSHKFTLLSEADSNNLLCVAQILKNLRSV